MSVKRFWLSLLTIWLTCVFVGVDAHAMSETAHEAAHETTHEAEHSHDATTAGHHHMAASSSDANASADDTTDHCDQRYCDQRHCGHCHAVCTVIKEDGRVGNVGSTKVFNTLLGHRGTVLSSDIERPKWSSSTPAVVSL